MWMKQIGPNIFTEFSPDEMFFCVFTVVAGLAWFEDFGSLITR